MILNENLSSKIFDKENDDGKLGKYFIKKSYNEIVNVYSLNWIWKGARCSLLLLCSC